MSQSPRFFEKPTHLVSINVWLPDKDVICHLDNASICRQITHADPRLRAFWQPIKTWETINE